MALHRSLLATVLTLMGVGAPAQDLKEGAVAPPIEAVDQSGKTIRLSDFAGRSSVVLYFYPKDDTPGCTAQACSLRDGYSDLQAAGAVILGVSADDSLSHKAFAEKFSLPFSLLADPEKRIIQAYGVSNALLFGRAQRVTFIIDRKGVIRKVIRSVDTKRHDQQVLEVLRSLT